MRILLRICLLWMIFVVVGAARLSFGAEPRLDVNDISYLWPTPATQDDVARLMSASDKTAAGTSTVWPTDVFNAVLEKAGTIAVTNSAGRQNSIDFRPFDADFKKPETWKVAGIRVDPSAPGCDPKVTSIFGSVPQIRLIMQPVTVDAAGKVRVHDFTAHLVYSFVSGTAEPGVPNGPPRIVPDKVKFREIVNDLKDLKAAAEAASTPTVGPLSIHPGLKANIPGFSDQVKSVIQKHLSRSNMSGVAFMGIQAAEPWIFFSMTSRSDGIALFADPAFGGKTAQMLNFSGGTSVMPQPTTKNIDPTKGVSTALLFDGDVAGRLTQPVFAGVDRPVHNDIPDIIANPRISHFFNTDCVSCHSESSRRKVLNIAAPDATFKFQAPPGVSGVDPALLPQSQWNVRNFGWFPRGGTVMATISQRTANEAAETVDFVNHEYLGQGE